MRRHILLNTLAASCLTLLGGGAIAQIVQPDYQGQPYNRNYDSRYYERSARVLFADVREGLDRAQSTALPFTGDWRRIRQARFEVDRLQQEWYRGDQSQQQYNRTIAALRNVADSNNLTTDTRHDLARDIERIRDLFEG